MACAAAAPGSATSRSALDAGEVFKTYAFRGATHLLTPEEGGAYLALRASGRQWELPSWQETYGLAPGDWPAFRETVREAVAEGPLTREELAVAVARRRRSVRPQRAWQRLRHPVEVADVAGRPVLRAGARRSGTVQGLHWVKRWAGLPDIDDAGRWAVEAYVRAYGPTTADGVQYYLGAGLSAGRKALRSWLDDCRTAWSAVDIDGEDLLVFADDVDDLTSTAVSPTIRLLPAADPWVMGPGTANPRVVPPAHRATRDPRRQPRARERCRGRTWTRKAGTLSVAWFAVADPPDHDLLGAEAARLATFLGTELDLKVTSG